jgi:hypothetical protein
MTALHDFIRASASYFGLPVDQLTEGSTLDTTRGDMEVVLRVALLPNDVAEIAQRMERMALEARVDAQVAEQQAAAQVIPTRDQMRDAYNALTPSERSAYGSFYRYCVAVGMGVTDPYVPSAEPEEKVEIPKVVWLDRSEATEQQKVMAVGVDERGRYGMDADDLTYEQRKARGMQP